MNAVDKPGVGIDYLMEYMGLAILIIISLMVLLCVVMFVIGFVQKAKRRNDPLTKKTKLLEMYEAEERKKKEEAEKKLAQKEAAENAEKSE